MMMDSAQVKTTFVRLKPKCDAFLNNPSKTTLAPLVSEYRELYPKLLQDIHPYLLFPYTVHLRNPQVKSTELKMAMVDAMHEVFSKTNIDSVDTYIKYLTLMIFQKFDKTTTEAGSIDEDFALSVIKVITTMTLRLPHNHRINLYTRSNATKLGQGIFICVQLAKKERYRALRLAAINCILALCSVHDSLIEALHSPRFSLQFANCVGDVLMFFLPGLLGAMQDIAKGEQKQGHAITCLAITTITRVLCLTLMDKAEFEKPDVTDNDFLQLIYHPAVPEEKNGQEEPDPFGMKLRAKGIEGMKEHLENAKRNKDWYHAAGQKLILLMKSIVPVQYHPHERVRLEMSVLCANVILYCPKNMAPSLKYILEMLIVLSEDDVEEVADISKKALEHFVNKTPTINQRQLLDMLEENFNNVFTKLPRYLNKLELNLQVRGIRLLKGYLRLLSSKDSSPQRLTKILSCPHILNRFAIVLVEMFKLETSGIKLLVECAMKDVDSPRQAIEPWKVYMYLQNELSVKDALEICKVLGKSDAIEIIVDYLLEQYRLDNEYKKEIILILNEMLKESCVDSDRTYHLVRNVILTYIDYENWYLPITVDKSERPLSKSETLDPTIYNPREWVKESTFDLYEGATETRYTDVSYRQEDECLDQFVDSKDSCKTLVQAQDNIVKIALMTEGIGKIARNMKKNFQPYLLKTLYLILERAGSGVEAIHYAGSLALNDLAKAFELADITELIKMNVDYFTHHVNIKLRKITDNADVLDVLLVVIRFSESEVLPCLYEIVSNALEQYGGLYTQQNAKLFLKLFLTFIKYIETEFFEKNNINVEKTVKDNVGYENAQSILSDMKEFQKNMNIIKDFESSVNSVDDEDTNGDDRSDDEENETSSDDKKEIPTHIKMVISVLKHTINFLPSNNLQEKLLSLDILKFGIVLIKDYEDELLPLVHQIWSPLVPRFKETAQPVVINRSFKLLATLAFVSEDFIRRRTMKDVLPLLCDYLMRRSKNSLLKDVGSSYRFTQAYKLQLLLVENLADLCISLNLQEKCISDVICVVQKYLSRKQPKPLQKACVNFFKRLSEYDIGACWLHLHGIWNDGSMNARLDELNLTSLNKLKFPIIDPPESKDCKTNVSAIIESLNVN